ncbi:MAG: heavy metal-binding domain-containing protein [Candidatus Omnitrophica bacterium]|nr:heavy metal-binding domain-containing protein [Candidatus Omnitrophota bacterium]
MEDLITGGFLVVFFIVSYFIGTRNEKRHFAEIIEREKSLASLPAVTFEKTEDRPVQSSKLVTGNVVIAGDFFKQVVAKLASFFGVRISVAESMLDRARREAVLRMKEQAHGADIILNVNFASMKLGQRQQIVGIEVMACGTAIYYAK